MIGMTGEKDPFSIPPLKWWKGQLKTYSEQTFSMTWLQLLMVRTERRVGTGESSLTVMWLRTRACDKRACCDKSSRHEVMACRDGPWLEDYPSRRRMYSIRAAIKKSILSQNRQETPCCSSPKLLTSNSMNGADPLAYSAISETGNIIQLNLLLTKTVRSQFVDGWTSFVIPSSGMRFFQGLPEHFQLQITRWVEWWIFWGGASNQITFQERLILRTTLISHMQNSVLMS